MEVKVGFYFIFKWPKQNVKVSKQLRLVMVQCWLTQGQKQNKVTKIQ